MLSFQLLFGESPISNDTNKKYGVFATIPATNPDDIGSR